MMIRFKGNEFSHKQKVKLGFSNFFFTSLVDQSIIFVISMELQMSISSIESLYCFITGYQRKLNLCNGYLLKGVLFVDHSTSEFF